MCTAGSAGRPLHAIVARSPDSARHAPSPRGSGAAVTIRARRTTYRARRCRLLGVTTRAWSCAAPPASRTPGTRSRQRDRRTRRRTAAASAPLHTTPCAPALRAKSASRSTSSSTSALAFPHASATPPRQRRQHRHREHAARVPARLDRRLEHRAPPAACTVTSRTPSAAAFRAARDGVRDVVELEVEKDVAPIRAQLLATIDGPAAVKSSLPTFRIRSHRPAARRSAAVAAPASERRARRSTSCLHVGHSSASDELAHVLARRARRTTPPVRGRRAPARADPAAPPFRSPTSDAPARMYCSASVPRGDAADAEDRQRHRATHPPGREHADRQQCRAAHAARAEAERRPSPLDVDHEPGIVFTTLIASAPASDGDSRRARDVRERGESFTNSGQRRRRARRSHDLAQRRADRRRTPCRPPSCSGSSR